MREWWFVIILFLLPFVAWVSPESGAYDGTLHSKQLNQVFIAIIFFISGLTFRLEEISRAASKFKVNSAIFLFCFGFIPLVTTLSVSFFGFSDSLSAGIIITSCLPISAASCVSLTSMTRGDRAVAFFSATATNIVGAFLVPVLLGYLLKGSSISVDQWSIILTFSTLVILPMFFGKLCSYLFSEKVLLLPLFRISEILLLFIIYTAFCNSFLHINALNIAGKTILALCFVLTVLHVLFIVCTYLMTSVLRFNNKEMKAALFTAPQKTVAIGIPINIALIQMSPELTMADFPSLTLPLLIYYNVQWIAAGVMLLVLRSYKN